MPQDAPIGYINGCPVWDNSRTVCVVATIAEIGGKRGILAIRRATPDGRGKLALPGGFQMNPEPWQVCGVRELAEETGFVLAPYALRPTAVITDQHGTNLLFSASDAPAVAAEGAVLDGEASELRILTVADLRPEHWAFPYHLVHAFRAVNAFESGTRLTDADLICDPAEFQAYLDDITVLASVHAPAEAPDVPGC